MTLACCRDGSGRLSEEEVFMGVSPEGGKLRRKSTKRRDKRKEFKLVRR